PGADGRFPRSLAGSATESRSLESERSQALPEDARGQQDRPPRECKEDADGGVELRHRRPSRRDRSRLQRVRPVDGVPPPRPGEIPAEEDREGAAPDRRRHLRRLRAVRGADQPQAAGGPSGHHPLHPLQGRAGEEGEVLRLSRPLPGSAQSAGGERGPVAGAEAPGQAASSTRSSSRPTRNWSPCSTKVGAERRRKVPLEPATSFTSSRAPRALSTAWRPETKPSPGKVMSPTSRPRRFSPSRRQKAAPGIPPSRSWTMRSLKPGSGEPQAMAPPSPGLTGRMASSTRR